MDHPPWHAYTTIDLEYAYTALSADVPSRHLH